MKWRGTIIKKFILILLIFLPIFASAGNENMVLSINAYRDGFYSMSLKYASKYLEDPASDQGRGKYMVGLCQFKMKKYDAALITFNSILIDHPGFENKDKVLLYSAIVNYYRKDMKKVFSTLNELKTGNLAPDAFYYCALFHNLQGDDEAAVGEYAKLIKKYLESSKWDAANLELAELYKKQGRFDLEDRLIRAYLHRTPDGKYADKIRFLLAFLLYETGEYDEGLEIFAQLAKKDFLLGETYYFIAECYFYLESYTKAGKFYQRALDFNTPHQDEALRAMFLSKYRVQDLEGAKDTVFIMKQPGRKIDPASIGYFDALILKSNKKYTQAADKIKELLSKSVSSELKQNLLLLYGDVMNLSDNGDPAVEYMIKMNSDAKFPAVFELAGDLRFNSGKYLSAAEYYKSAISEGVADPVKSGELRVKLASSYFALSHYGPALELLNAYEFSGTDRPFNLIMGKVLFKSEKGEKALEYLSLIPVETKEYAEAQRYIGWCIYSAGNHFDAINHWGKFLEGNTQDEEIYHQIRFDMAKVYYELKNNAMALPLLSELFTKGLLEQNEVIYYLSRVYYKIEKYSEARKYFLMITANSTFGQEAEFYAAWCLLNMKENEKAIVEFEKIRLKPGHEYRYDSALKIGDIHYSTGEYDAAVTAFKTLMDNADAPGEFKGWAAYNYEWTLFKMGKYQSSIDVSTNFLKKYPDSAIAPQIQLNKGKFYFSKDNFTNGITEFQRVIMQYPLSKEINEARFYLGLSFMKLGNTDKAFLYFEELSKLKDSVKWKNLGIFKLASIQFAEEKFREAAANYKLLLAEEIDQKMYENILYNLGVVYKKLREYDAATGYFERLLNETKDNELRGEVYLKLGDIYEILGYHKRSEAAFSSVIVNGTPIQQVEAEYWLGELLLNKGEIDRAIEEFMKIVYLYKEFTMWVNSARFKIVEAYMKKDDADSAARMLELIIQKSGDPDSRKKARQMLHEMEKEE